MFAVRADSWERVEVGPSDDDAGAGRAIGWQGHNLVDGLAALLMPFSHTDDGLTIWRPLRLTRTARKAYELKRIPASHRQHEQLWLIGLAILLGDANERQVFAIW